MLYTQKEEFKVRDKVKGEQLKEKKIYIVVNVLICTALLHLIITRYKQPKKQSINYITQLKLKL